MENNIPLICLLVGMGLYVALHFVMMINCVQAEILDPSEEINPGPSAKTVFLGDWSNLVIVEAKPMEVKQIFKKAMVVKPCLERRYYHG